MKLPKKQKMEQILFLIITIFASFVFSGICTDVYSKNDFPEGFVFGSGTSSFQWEGATAEDGKGPSIWDEFNYRNPRDEEMDCDGYHKYKEDVKLMYDMGLDAFRISISWPRLIPSGRGPVNPKGLQFYKNFIAELKRNGIEPHVTLYHNDLPQVLEDEYQGWLDRRIIDDFTAFADVCFREFGNEVKFWWTINEPNMLGMAGYDLGNMPPQHCSPPFGVVNCSRGNSSTEPYLALHNMLLAHASTVKLYNQKYKEKQNGSIGITCFTYWMVPLTSSQEDEIAAQRAKDFFMGWVLHPLVFGDYPQVMKRIVGDRLPSFSQEESLLLKDSFDFLGLIHYTVVYNTPVSNSLEERDYLSDMNAELIPFGNSTRVQFDVLPWGLEGVLEYIKQVYGNPPIYVLENGQPGNYYASLDDVGRVNYLHAYIASVLKSVRNGSDTRGYFQWSFMDLYEFVDPNYTYGLYYVNFSDPERKRTPKLSAFWYSAFLNGDSNTTFLGSQGIAQSHSNFSSSS